jgi:hypothetical protein
MATEYDFYVAAELSTTEILQFMATAVGGQLTEHGFVARDGLQVTAYAVEPSEEVYPPRAFDFTGRTVATFRFSNTAAEEVEQLNTGRMVAAVLSFFAEHPGRGVLLFNGEEVVIQRLSDKVEINSEWEWGELAALDRIRAEHVWHPLPQPLL